MDTKKLRVRELFWAACELPSASRTAFLEEECGGDAALLDEVTSLLAAHDASEGFLETPPAAAVASRAPDLPERIRGYRVLDVLGEGGMGVVYLAEQEVPLSRRVALKVIKPGMDTREVIARFESERQALARMSHSGIAKVYDSGTTEDGRPYFAMEHVPGVAITAYCDQNRLGVRERLEVFRSVCEAVQHAHQKAIIHRDLKPSNVLAMREGERVVAKVIDFGIARALDRGLGPSTLVTEHGRFVGTPEYMSPEQAVPAEGDIDTRTDIYSLGVLLYELLAGALPFDPRELRGSDLAELQRTIREVDPPRPSTRLRGLGPLRPRVAADRATDSALLEKALRGDLDAIVSKAIDKDRARRYASASELAADVTRHLDGEPVLARPPTVAYRLSKLLRRHRMAVAAVLAVVASLAAGLGVSLHQFFRADAARIESERLLVEKDNALARSRAFRLTAQSAALAGRNPRVALLLALEGARAHRTRQANNALLRALLAYVPHRVLRDHSSWVVAAEFSADGRRVLSAAHQEAARLWDADTGELLAVLDARDVCGDSAAFSPDGRFVFTKRGSRAAIWSGDGKRLHDLRGHRDLIQGAAFSPDSRRLVTAGSDRIACIWTVEPGTLERELRGHTDKLRCAAFRADGLRVVTSSIDGTARIWSVETGETLRVLAAGRGARDVYRCAFSSDGRVVATGASDGRARLWDAESGEERFLLEGHRGLITDLAFRADGALLATASADGTVRTWDTASGECARVFDPSSQIINSVAFSRNGLRLLTSSYDATARVWDVASGREVLDLREHSRRVNSAVYSADGLRIVTASWDGNVCVWESESFAQKLVLGGHSAKVITVARSPDGGRWLTASTDGTACLSSLRADRHLGPNASARGEPIVLSGHGGAVSAACFSADGRRIVTASTSGAARVWDAASGEALWTLAGHRGGLRSAVFSADGRWIATASQDGDARLWDAHSGELAVVFSGHTAALTGAEFSPDSALLLTASDDGTVRVWDVARLEGVHVLAACSKKDSRGGIRRVRAALFSPRRRRIATAADDGSVRLWDVARAREERRLEGHPSRVLELAFDPAGKRLLGGCDDDGAACLWDVETGELKATLRGHKDYVRSVSFSRDGRLALTASTDHTARIWDAASGEEVMTLEGHAAAVDDAVFSPDGVWVATASEDHTARLWPLDVLAYVEGLDLDGLTAQEHVEYGVEADERAADHGRR